MRPPASRPCGSRARSRRRRACGGSRQSKGRPHRPRRSPLSRGYPRRHLDFDQHPRDGEPGGDRRPHRSRRGECLRPDPVPGGEVLGAEQVALHPQYVLESGAGLGERLADLAQDVARLHLEVVGHDLHSRRVDGRSPRQKEEVTPTYSARDERLRATHRQHSDNDLFPHRLPPSTATDENRSYGMQNDAFRIGMTRDVLRPDGSLVFAPVGLELLDEPGIEWGFLDEDRRELTSDQLVELDGLFHFSPAVSAASLEGVERLALIARHGVGLDFIDLDACTERGIAVTITPAGVTRPMASAAVALVLALSHRLIERERLLRAGRWSDGCFDLLGLGLTGRTLGVVGYGRIGREVVRLLRPWEMRVLVSQRSDPRDAGVEHVPLDALLEQADVVVLACPLTQETYHLLDATRLERLKTGALLVNVARGPIVDQEALAGALASGRVGGAGLDVF